MSENDNVKGFISSNKDIYLRSDCLNNNNITNPIWSYLGKVTNIEMGAPSFSGKGNNMKRNIILSIEISEEKLKRYY